ncbi:MAG: carboxypeptidase-like regulatory domain-containing protein [Flavobacteriaceae bacterium]|nr:carboxypeptidase-like regulatory domain-containing protein [Flavobacteriaceae bacterium]
MPNFKILVLLYFISISLSGYSQNKGAVSGVVVNKEDNEPLPFASIILKNHPIGTLSNEEGEFDFYIPQSKRNDTIQISFIGFITYEIPVSSALSELNIQLQPSSEVLDEVVLSKLSPLDFIKNALVNIDQNYEHDHFQTIAYYREKFIENGNIISKKEAVFKTYYTAKGDTAKNQHQLLLYKPIDKKEDFQFMRDWIDKRIEKEKKKAKKKGEDFDEDFDFEKDMNMGGPEMIIEMADIRNEASNNNFLNPKHFKKYEYTFGEEKVYNGEVLVTIHYKALKKIESVKDHGIILISKGDYAIALIEGSGELTIPVVAKPVLFLIGLSVSNPKFRNTVSYQKYKDKWYPKLFRWDATITLKKRHMFKANEKSDLKIGQVFFINQLDSIATSVPKEKRFNTKEDMEDQIYNDMNISWEGMNVLKD